MPRTVPVRSALAALVCAFSVAWPVAAHAEPQTLTVTVGADPVAGLPNGIDYEYDTAGQELNLTIVTRPASGPACGATAPIDATLVGASGGSTYVTPTPIALAGRGGARVPFTFASPGPARVCAWLVRSPDDVAAAAIAAADVRLPHASVTLAATELSPKADGADVSVRATGTSEAPADLYVMAVAGTTGCPPTYDENTDPTVLDPTPAGTRTRVTGDFDVTFQTHALLTFKPWRICAFLQDGTTAAAASTVGTAVIDLVLRPALVRRPRVRQRGSALACDGGKWRARPAAKLSYAWLANGTKLAGATGKRLAIKPALRGKRLACRVTAVNRIGRSTATARAVVAR